jgi:urate oxidase
MPATLATAAYGKSKVRLARLFRDGESHRFSDCEVTVTCHGRFEATHASGDNTGLYATDSMRNSVYALAAESRDEEDEAFALRLTRHLLDAGPLADSVEVQLAERSWRRLEQGDAPHPHAFRAGGPELRVTRAGLSRDGAGTAGAGVHGLLLLKTTGSAFSGFARDPLTTLPETRDRIMASSVDISWTYSAPSSGHGAIIDAARGVAVDLFSNEHSDSVQQTAHRIACVVSELAEDITEVSVSMPNLHYIPWDMQRFGLEDRREIFVATNEPHGQIDVTVRR